MFSLFGKLRDFILKCARVWLVTKKPDYPEFKVIAKASGVGILALGLIGLIIAVAFKLF